jgi:hypothetical protein
LDKPVLRLKNVQHDSLLVLIKPGLHH